MKARTAPLSVSGTDLTITGVNVHIVRGSGRTDDGIRDSPGKKVLTGLSNLIIGYNKASGRYASVSSGSNNTASGNYHTSWKL